MSEVLQKERDKLGTYRNKAPATNNGSKNLTTADVNVLGAERHEVVCCADRVGGDVDAERDDEQGNGAESGSSAATVGPVRHPQTDDLDGVPDDLAVCCLSGCSSEDA